MCERSKGFRNRFRAVATLLGAKEHLRALDIVQTVESVFMAR